MLIRGSVIDVKIVDIGAYISHGINICTVRTSRENDTNIVSARAEKNANTRMQIQFITE